MGHAEVLELIDMAALEPGGLERLTAGDTPEAAAVAGHLAGCVPCRDELAATARAASVSAEAIRELPDPALKARTLAFVREVGVDRSGRAAGSIAGPNATPFARPVAVAPGPIDQASPGPMTPNASPFAWPVAPGANDPVSPRPRAPRQAPIPANVVPMRANRRRAAWWTAASVAAVIVAGVAGFVAGGAAASRPGDPVAAMAAAKTTIHIAEQPDVAHFALASTTGDMTGGTVIYSASIGEISMAATGLRATPGGAAYACWVEVDGQRRRIGVMYVDGSDGTWAGWVDGLDKLGANPIFGVSLVKDGESSGTPILRGGG